MFKPRQADISKDFFRKERSFYSDWHEAFFRELIQNSVDAGASNIDIDIVEDEAVSVFNQPKPSSGLATRITVTDDGSGMSLDVLDNVYFKGQQRRMMRVQLVGLVGPI